MKLRVLVACEESQAVTKELRRLGHEAYSCDILPCSGGHPDWHIMQDVIPLLDGNSSFHTVDGNSHNVDGKWDCILAFPPCTHLALSGAKHFAKKRADGRQRDGIEFFCKFFYADCDRILIENPLNIIKGGDYIKTHFPDLAERYSLPRPCTQVIQPWMFGDPFEKSTCLWLKGIRPIRETNCVQPEPRHITSGGISLPAWYSNSSRRMPGNRQSVRSKTFPGIARALAEQITEQWAGDAREVQDE